MASEDSEVFTDDATPMLSKANGDSSATTSTPPGAVARYYTLPKTRYRNIAEGVLIVDGILSLALWISGGHTKYFTDSILHFHFLESTFDLALISSIKLVILILLYSKLESITLAQISNPYEPSTNNKKKLVHALLILFSLVQPVYSTVKGSLILYKMETTTSYVHMHPPYNALVISAIAFGFIELVVALVSFYAMRKLKLSRIEHWLNDQGQEVDKEGKVVTSQATLKRVFGLAKQETPLILAGIFCLLISSGANTAAPFFFGLVVDAAQRSMDELNRTVIILLIIYVIGAICSTFRSWFFTLAGQRLVARLRKDLFNSIIKQEIAFFDTTRTGELTNRLSSDSQVVQNALTVNISMLARYILQIVGSLALMFVLNASLTGVLLAVVPIVAIGAVQYGTFVKKLTKEFQNRLADASTTAEEAISSIRTVRSFVGEPKASGAYGDDIDKSYQIGKKLAFVRGGFDGTFGLLSYGAISLVLWYGGKLVYEGHVSPGLLTSFLLYTLQVAMAFALLSSLYADFMKAVGASVRIFELMDRLPTVPISGGQSLQNLYEGLKFDNVFFTYPSRPDSQVLKGVSFTVNPGEMVALVGPSGGGKSTIVSLIERFYDPESGAVMLGNCNIKELDPYWLRQQIAIVSQEPTLFACSIKDNIQYGKCSSDEKVIEIAKQANAHDFISTFEDGYDTKVGERGVRLSGGQKQRVAIARALIVDPSILLLDEATSALDAESEHLVQEAIDRAMVNRTVLVIAHRLSTVRNAHKVLVIDKGTIVEQGTHEELLELGGVYKKLVLRQLMAGANDLGPENNAKSNNIEESLESSQSTEPTEYPPVQPENFTPKEDQGGNINDDSP